MPLPNFIIAGASKSGTTSLWEYLKSHPQVCMASIKETNFFTREAPSGRFDKGLAWYENLFKACAEAKGIGEATPGYMIKIDAPGLIAQTLPDVQLIFLLRDPVDRLYSQYWFHRQQGQQLPNFDEMVKVGANGQRSQALSWYLFSSSYHLHLERYLEYFPKEQITVFLYDDLQQDPPVFMQQVCRVIGVDPSIDLPNISRAYNTARRARLAWFQRLIKALGPRIMRIDLPEWLFSFFKRSRKTLWALNTATLQYPPIDPELRQELIEELSKAIEYVERYLNRPLPSWRT
jgi:hypothetical protein